MVDFVRPGSLGTRAEFRHLFGRPVEKGQVIGSDPAEIQRAKERVYVLLTLLKNFVQRRSHAVLRDTLPRKEEHVLFLRMTPLQRDLYRQQLNQLSLNKSVSNPLKTFAVCLKILNHPEMLYNSFKDNDLELDDEASEMAATNATEDQSEGESAAQADPLAVPGTKNDSTSSEWAEEFFKGKLLYFSIRVSPNFIIGVLFLL